MMRPTSTLTALTAPATTSISVRTASDTATIDAHLIGLTASDAPEFEQYLVLRQAIERAHAASGLSVIAVTSATTDDGKKFRIETRASLGLPF